MTLPLLKFGTWLLIVLAVWLLVILVVEVRFLPSETMKPTLKIGDRVLVDKLSAYLRKPHMHGEIIVFYPPEIELGRKYPSGDWGHILGRITGLAIFPNQPAFIKRVIGLPGDSIRIERGKGVFVNGQFLKEEKYVLEPPTYSLNVLGDIGGRNIAGNLVRPYTDASQVNNEIVVPEGKLFVLGDNRNKSEDSHVYGFVDSEGVIGRVCARIYPSLAVI